MQKIIKKPVIENAKPETNRAASQAQIELTQRALVGRLERVLEGLGALAREAGRMKRVLEGVGALAREVDLIKSQLK